MNKSIFDYKGHEYFALLNWQYHHSTSDHSLHIMAEGYSKTVELTMNYLLENIISNVERDKMIFPILYNFHHYIELKIKGCLMYISLIDSDSSEYIDIISRENMKNISKKDKTIYKFPNTHDLSILIAILEKAIYEKNIFGEKFSINEKLKDTRIYIHNLYKHPSTQLSQSLDLFRFPLTSKQNQYSYVGSEENIGISINNLRDSIIAIYHELDSLSEFLNPDNKLRD